jgi:lysophospholipase L1-like esterase
MTHRTPALSLALTIVTLSGCTQSITDPDPPPPPDAVATEVVVFYDENGNGEAEATESLRLADVRVTSGTSSARTEPSTGRAVLPLVPGQRTIDVAAETLPPFFTASPLSVTVPATGPVFVPATLPIGSNRPHTYMGFGDSLTSKTVYLNDLKTKLVAARGKAQMINEGLFATRSGEGAARIHAVLKQRRPAYTLLLYGTNDWRDALCRSRLQCDTVDNLRYMIEAARAYQSLPLLATIPPVDADGSRPAVPPDRNEWIRQVNEHIRALAREEGVVLVELEEPFLAEPSLDPLFVDHIHPSPAGAAIMAEQFFAALTRRE